MASAFIQAGIPKQAIAIYPGMGDVGAAVLQHCPKSLIFGGTLFVLGATLAIINPNWNIPSEFWLMLPYVITLVVLAGAVGRTRLPAALGLPYRRAATTATV